MVEGSGKWLIISCDQVIINVFVDVVMIFLFGIINQKCLVIFLIVYLVDYKVDMFNCVLYIVENFVVQYSVSDGEYLVEFFFVVGNVGIEVVINIEVEKGIVIMYLVVYGVMVLFCLFIFCSWRVILVVLILLLMIMIICKVLMVWLGIGLKVVILLVIVVGVGVGVDYVLYLLSV